jgi:hypothetical protein
VKPAIPVSRRTFRCDPRLSCWTQVDVAFDDQRLVANAGLLLPAAQGVPGPARRSGRPASDLERPSTITVSDDPRRSSPALARQIRVAVSHSSSHALRVSRSLVGEEEGVRSRRRAAPWGW